MKTITTAKLSVLLSCLTFIFLGMKVNETATLQVTSRAFENEKLIPMKYTCEGENISPPLEIKNIPPNAKSIAIIMEDPDATKGTFDHWVQYNIPVDKNFIPENNAPGVSGKNGKGSLGYIGPCPPTGTHRYFFRVYALNVLINSKEIIDKQTLIKEMKDHILATGDLIGLYKKNEIAR